MRVLFVLAMLCWVVVLGVASALLYFLAFNALGAGNVLSVRALVLPTLLLLGAGACGAAMFMSPAKCKKR